VADVYEMEDKLELNTSYLEILLKTRSTVGKSFHF